MRNVKVLNLLKHANEMIKNKAPIMVTQLQNPESKTNSSAAVECKGAMGTTMYQKDKVGVFIQPNYF